MMKKTFLSLLIAVLAISATACGEKQNDNSQGASDHAKQNNSASEEQDTVSNNDKESQDQFDESHNLFYGDSLFKDLDKELKDADVISNDGATTQFALEKGVDKITKKDPQNVFILLGSDDLFMPKDDPVEYSMKYYKKFIEKLKEKLPDTRIHTLSVPPVTKEAQKKDSQYKNLSRYNQALKEMASQEKIDYIDISPVAKQNQDLYKKDGVHFKSEFYPLLLKHIEKHIKSSKR